MGAICQSKPGVSTFFSGKVSGIIFNDSQFEIEYDICGTKSKCVKQTVSKDVSAKASISANPMNPIAIGGQASAASNQLSQRQIQNQDTLGQVWVKPHHYSNQGLVNLNMQEPNFFSLSYYNEQGEQDNLQSNILVTCRESITFLITKDLSCEPLDPHEVQYFKKLFNEDLDTRKAYRKRQEEPERKPVQTHIKAVGNAPDSPIKKVQKSGPH